MTATPNSPKTNNLYASAPPLPVAYAEIVPDSEVPTKSPKATSGPAAVGTEGKTKVETITYTIPAPSQTAQQEKFIPPGAKPGGVWMKQRYVGPKTGAATVAGVLVFCLPGLLFLCFPLDKRYVYCEPGSGGRLLKGSGKVVTGGNTPKMVPPGYRGMNV